LKLTLSMTRDIRSSSKQALGFIVE